MDEDKSRVLIVGGGVSGLSCALSLAEAGRPVLVLEASDRRGGRVKTDVGDRLDRQNPAVHTCEAWIEIPMP